MTPFQEFRLWMRRAPAGERFAAGTAAALVIAVVAWLLVPAPTATDSESVFPSSSTSGEPTTGGGVAPGATGATAVTSGASSGATTGSRPGSTGGRGAIASTTTGSVTTGRATTGATTGATSGTAGSGASTTGGGKTCPSGSASGVTAGRIKIAVVVVSIAGAAGNNTFGIATPEQQQSYYRAVIDEVNAHGGVACRTLAPQFFTGNPADQSGLKNLCLEVAAAGVFAVLDVGAYANFPIENCFAQAKIPYFGSYLVSRGRQHTFYPYLFNFNMLDSLYNDALFALKDRGFFSAAKGFSKLGVLYRDCDKDIWANFNRSLAAVGVPPSQIVPFNVGCPTVFAAPSSIQQAVLKFQQAGVTNVTTAYDVGDFATFTKVAQQQRFKPKYGLADDSLVTISYGSQKPDPDNLDGAVAITASREGEERTPGFIPTAGTQRCNAALKAKGIAPTYSLPAVAGNSCDNVWMFAAAVDHASVLKGDALAAGLRAAKSIDFSYPQGPSDFSRARTTTGGQYWRPVQFYKSCSCWKLLDRTFRKSYS